MRTALTAFEIPAVSFATTEGGLYSAEIWEASCARSALEFIGIQVYTVVYCLRGHAESGHPTMRDHSSATESREYKVLASGPSGFIGYTFRCCSSIRI